MEIPLQPVTESKLNQIALKTGQPADQVASELLAKYIEYDEWFRAEVQRGIDSLDRGEFLEHEEVVQMVERMLNER